MNRPILTSAPEPGLKLPPRFIRDCIESDCDVGQYRGGRLFASPAQLAELKDRAAFYASPDGPDQAGPTLRRSAARLLASIAKAERS